MLRCKGEVTGFPTVLKLPEVVLGTSKVSRVLDSFELRSCFMLLVVATLWVVKTNGFNRFGSVLQVDSTGMVPASSKISTCFRSGFHRVIQMHREKKAGFISCTRTYYYFILRYNVHARCECTDQTLIPTT